MSEVAWWQGSHGDEYTLRNTDADIARRNLMWRGILRWDGPVQPWSILEIGAGSGNNLRALGQMGYMNLAGVEPNKTARDMLKQSGIPAHNGTAANPGRKADLVFTSGVLIHVPPEELLEACQGIYDAAERYIVCIEYFSDEPEEKPYRGRKLWKRDFGSFWLDNFDLKPLGCGFEWKRTTGLDNLTWFAFEKCT
jgi:SAM-dependent methyltransferase